MTERAIQRAIRELTEARERINRQMEVLERAFIGPEAAKLRAELANRRTNRRTLGQTRKTNKEKGQSQDRRPESRDSHRRR